MGQIRTDHQKGLHHVPLCFTRGILMLGVLLWSLWGCGMEEAPSTQPVSEATDEGVSRDIALPLPSALERLVVEDPQNLSVSVSIDGTPVASSLEVDQTNRTFSLSLSDLTPGSRTLEVVFSYKDVEVVRVRQDVTVEAGKTTQIQLTGADYQYIDTDGDGFTNLAELALGTTGNEWNDPSARPPTETIRHSQNYVLKDTAGIVPLQGDTLVVGTATSSNYTLR